MREVHKAFLLGAAVPAALLAWSAQAQGTTDATTAPDQAAQDAAPPPAAAGDEIVVTGIRANLLSALNTKRNANAAIDVINADDIADFPDANLAESLQRLPGITINRENGEGRQITVRGLGGDFTPPKTCRSACWRRSSI